MILLCVHTPHACRVRGIQSTLPFPTPYRLLPWPPLLLLLLPPPPPRRRRRTFPPYKAARGAQHHERMRVQLGVSPSTSSPLSPKRGERRLCSAVCGVRYRALTHEGAGAPVLIPDIELPLLPSPPPSHTHESSFITRDCPSMESHPRHSAGCQGGRECDAMRNVGAYVRGAAPRWMDMFCFRGYRVPLLEMRCDGLPHTPAAER